jgi:light-regulated signal transduction histidine kinase (bacteriophytochrome)
VDRATRTSFAARAPQELKQVRADGDAARAELEMFEYAVSHDLRAPLRAIDGFADALQEDCQDSLDESGREYLGHIRLAAQKLARMIDGLLQLSRIGRADLRPEKVDLSRVCDELLTEVRRADPGRQAQVTIQPRVIAFCDRELIREALRALLGNAWKFTRSKTSARIEFGWMQGTDDPVFYVRDNGVGFAAQSAEKLFVPFQRFHTSDEFPGIGMGLAISKRVINKHGGQIRAVSSPNTGATFYFTLGKEAQVQDG